MELLINNKLSALQPFVRMIDFLPIMTRVISDDNIELLIFIDGDQAINTLKEIESAMGNIISLHVFVTIANGNVPGIKTKFDRFKWITWIHTASNLKDAADLAIVGQVHMAAGKMLTNEPAAAISL